MSIVSSNENHVNHVKYANCTHTCFMFSLTSSANRISASHSLAIARGRALAHETVYPSIDKGGENTAYRAASRSAFIYLYTTQVVAVVTRIEYSYKSTTPSLSSHPKSSPLAAPLPSRRIKPSIPLLSQILPPDLFTSRIIIPKLPQRPRILPHRQP